jgi:3-phenylpropionate/trans-cinnamate dioxygenase ferredoxin reductase subunit
MPVDDLALRSSLPSHVDLLAVGGGVAAARCVRALRRQGFRGSILMVGEEGLPPYNRPPLSKEVLLADDPPPDELLFAEPEGWYARRDVLLARGARVASIDPGPRTAILSDGTRVGWDRCLIATGATPRALRIPGGERALLLRTANDARSLRAAMDAQRGGAAVVVVGGGFIGLEVASALAARGLSATVVERGDALWGGQLGRLLDVRARELLAAAGVTVRLGAAVTRLDGQGAWVADELLPASLVVAGVGVTPRDELARAAGLAVEDGILVDAGGRTSHPAIWAAGDVARVDGQRVEHWHAAREAGERVAASMLGQPAASVPVPWVFSEVAGTALDVMGTPATADEEAWLADERVVVSSRGGRAVGLAVLDGALAPKEARAFVGQPVAEVAAALEA